MMFEHPTALVDKERLDLFTLLGRGKRLFDEALFWIDGGNVAWVGTRVGTLGVGITWLGPGWMFDPLAQQQFRQVYAARLRAMQQADRRRHDRELAGVLDRLRLGGHAERLLWALHAAVREASSSLLSLSDQWLQELVWGSQGAPRHWRGELIQHLRALSHLHVSRWDDDDPPPFGPGTALLNLVRDLGGADEDRCPDYCPHHGLLRHRHLQVQIGPAFLGDLEDLGRLDPDTGTRAYAFLRGGPKHNGRSLWEVGKTGRLVSVFLPAKLGNPAACAKLTAEQHRLLQALVRETTRAKRKVRKEVSQAEMFEGNSIRSFNGKSLRPCSLLTPGTRYIGFNGNGKRKGLGYRLATEGGWLAKAGYAIDRVDAFLDDFAAVAELLKLVVIGVDRMNRFMGMEAIRKLGAITAGRQARERLHIRVYSTADYLARWCDLFQDTVPKTPLLMPLAEGMAGLLATMKRKRISQRRLAEGIKKKNPSFVSKILKGKKPSPKGLLKKAQRWLDKQPEPHARSRSTPNKSPRTKSNAEDDLLSVAFDLLRRAWSIVPQKPGAKKPCVLWKPYQDRLPTEEKWRQWASRWPDAGLALVLGPVSGVFVIDVDGEEAHRVLLERLGMEPMAPKALSGSREPCRYHLYFKCPDIPTKAKQTPWHPKLEFRGKGGIVVIPPSLHKSGNRYSWAKGRSPDDMDLPELPPQVLEALNPVPTTRSAPRATRKLSVSGIDASERTLEFLSGKHAEGPQWNAKLFAAACDLCGRGMPVEEGESLLLAGAQPWNQGEAEAARRTIRSAYSQPREPARL